jgi:ureidoglycolate lyase
VDFIDASQRANGGRSCQRAVDALRCEAMKKLPIEPLDAAAYAPFGTVVEAGAHGGSPANQGTARRFDHLGPVEALRSHAPWNLCVFRCAPRDLTSFEVRLLEKHPRSTQLFVPMNASRFLVVVAQGTEADPDPTTLRAFLATGRQGITYHPGVWHHPLLAMDHETDFACLVSEDGGAEDCAVRDLAEGERWWIEVAPTISDALSRA